VDCGLDDGLLRRNCAVHVQQHEAVANLCLLRQHVKVFLLSALVKLRSPRGVPSLRTCLLTGFNHSAHIMQLPNFIQDMILQVRKGIPANLLTHLRRELFMACWAILLSDPEFCKAYFCGILILCWDGVWRRVFPRFFTYLADYPERCLIAGIREQGGFPCPCCYIKKHDMFHMGSVADMAAQLRNIRINEEWLQANIEEARTMIYKDGLAIANAGVEKLLKPRGLTPIRVCKKVVASTHSNLLVPECIFHPASGIGLQLLPDVCTRRSP
jgi:hypothetical protein